jgi:hypothetical protein
MEFGDKGDTAMAILLMGAVDRGELYDPQSGRLFDSEVLNNHPLISESLNTRVYAALIEGIIRAWRPQNAAEDNKRFDMAMKGLLGRPGKRGNKVKDIRDELLAMMAILYEDTIPDEILVDSTSWKCPDVDLAPIARQAMVGREYAATQESVERNLTRKFRENYAAIMARGYITEDWVGQKAYAIALDVEEVMRRHHVPIKIR